MPGRMTTPNSDVFRDQWGYPPWLAISLRGRVPSHLEGITNGLNNDVDIASVPQDIIAQGGTYVFPTSAIPMEVVSSSTSDTSAGIGVRTVRIFGLDISYN